MNEKKLINQQQLRFLLVGGSQAIPEKPNPCASWLSNKYWAQIEELSNTIPVFKGLDESF